MPRTCPEGVIEMIVKWSQFTGMAPRVRKKRLMRNGEGKMLTKKKRNAFSKTSSLPNSSLSKQKKERVFNPLAPSKGFKST